MSANVKTADLAITIVVTLLKAAGLGPEADRILDAIEGAKSCIGLIDDIKNEIVSDPNKDLIRSLFKTMEEEVRSIKDDLKEQGLGKDEIESTADALIETTRLTVKQLAQDDDALLDAARLPDSFFKVLVHRAEPLPDWCDDTIGKLYEQLLKRVSAEFIERAKDFDRFDKVALASLLRDNLSAKKQRNRIERGVQENRAINLETNRVVKEDRATGLETNQIVKELVQRHPYSIPSRLIFGSRPDVVAEDRFIERREQKQLNSLIADPTRGRTVLVGMRGCGKTQLAASLAKQCEDANWNLVAWLNAVSRESIQSDLVELAKQLGIGTSDQPTQEQIIARCLNYLRSNEASDRIVIFDNVEDINHLRGLMPNGNGLRVIATTTNNSGWEYPDWTIIKVGVFDRSESINYLLKVTASDDQNAADTLAERLGDLPLAIAQAGATARLQDLSLARYLKRLELRRRKPTIRAVPGSDYTDDIATALLMAVKDTIEGLERNTKETAQRQLGALALLAESGVPTRWLDPTVEQLNDDESPDTQRDTDEDAHDALTELIHRSIVQQSADGSTTMLHRLQAQVLRESWREEEREQACESAAALLGSVDIDRFRADDPDARFQETRNLIEQIRTISEQGHSKSLFKYEQIALILSHTLSHARDLGILYEALALEEPVLATLNMAQLDEIAALNLKEQLAYTYMYAEQFDKAFDLYTQVIDDRTAIQGHNHRDALSSRNNLAYAYYWEGHTDKAIDLFEQVLDDRTRILSSDHEDTLMTGSYLALAYADDGQLERAIALGEQVVKDRDRVLKPDHKHTLVTRNNLANAYKSAGRLTDAIKMYEYVLEARIRTLGNTHHHTRITRNDLAQTYEQAGDLPKA
ncbi:tetratricopeptide repeat protein, partial [Actinomyces sp. ICM47]|uniref:tetratricopeptide repeat protein n=1 Tax=Actinomyces sp. ICM47 TaxID=936548 RepID=UPI0025C3EDD8